MRTCSLRPFTVETPCSQLQSHAPRFCGSTRGSPATKRHPFQIRYIPALPLISVCSSRDEINLRLLPLIDPGIMTWQIHKQLLLLRLAKELQRRAAWPKSPGDTLSMNYIGYNTTKPSLSPFTSGEATSRIFEIIYTSRLYSWPGYPFQGNTDRSYACRAQNSCVQQYAFPRPFVNLAGLQI